MAIERINSAELASSVAVQPGQFAWFLGAGTSAASNIPTGYDMIVDFKARLFCVAVGVPRREIDPTDPLWLERIEAHFDGKHGLPPTGDPLEYAAAFEAVFPTESTRRNYIDRAVKRGTPSYGHRVLGSLIASHQISCLLTTNFDQLIERCAVVAGELLPAEGSAYLTVAALDSVARAERCLRESAWPLLVKLHGDYQSTQLKNISSELQSQDAALRSTLVGACNRFGLIIIGYSGRDTSIMKSLTDALEGPTPFPTGIRWVTRADSDLLPPVSDFLEVAQTAGIDVKVVQSETFDEFAAEIDRQVTLPAELAAHVRENRPLPIVQPVVLSTAEGAHFPVLRCSALPVLAFPAVARRLTLTRQLTTPEARSALKAAGVRGITAASGDEVLAFGVDEELEAAFAMHGGKVAGEVSLSPKSDSVHLGLLYDALVRALTRGRPWRSILRSGGHSIVVSDISRNRSDEKLHRDRERLKPLQRAYSDALVGRVPDENLPFAEGVRIRLECHDKLWWCVFDPFTWVDFPRPDQSADPSNDKPALRRARGATDPTGDWRKERWARRYNPKWAAIVDAWAALLVPGEDDTLHALGMRHHVGIDARFTLSGTTAWSRPTQAVPTSGADA